MAEIELMLSHLVGCREFKLRTRRLQRGKAADHVVFGLGQFACLNGEQRCAGRHHVTGACEHAGDAAGVGGEYRRVQIVVNGNLALGIHLRAERLRRHAGDF